MSLSTFVRENALTYHVLCALVGIPSGSSLLQVHHATEYNIGGFMFAMAVRDHVALRYKLVDESETMSHCGISSSTCMS